MPNPEDLIDWGGEPEPPEPPPYEPPQPQQQDASDLIDWGGGGASAYRPDLAAYTGAPDIAGDRATYQIPIQERIGGFLGEQWTALTQRPKEYLEGINRGVGEAAIGAVDWLTRPAREIAKSEIEAAQTGIERLSKGDFLGAAKVPFELGVENLKTGLETGGQIIEGLAGPARWFKEEVMGELQARAPRIDETTIEAYSQEYGIPMERARELFRGDLENSRAFSAVDALPVEQRQEAFEQLSKMPYSSGDRKLQALKDVQAGATWQEAINQNSDPWAELLGEVIFDPLNLIPASAAKVVFAPVSVPLEKAFELAGKGLGKIAQHIPWVKQAELAKKATIFGDEAADALGEFFTQTAQPRDIASKFGRAVTGEIDPMMSSKARGTMKEIVEMVKDAKQLGSKKALKPDQLTEFIWKKYSPSDKPFTNASAEQLQHVLTRAATDVYRKSIGLAPVDTAPGMISRALQWSGSFMKEIWLFSPAYAQTNAPSDFLRSALTGHRINPLEFTAAQQATDLMKSVGFTVPRRVSRGMTEGLTGKPIGRLGAIEKIPVPLIGKPQEFAKMIKKLTGVDLVKIKGKRLGQLGPIFADVAIDDLKPIQKLARNFNVGSIMAGGLDFLGRMEQNSRLTMFMNEFRKAVPPMREKWAATILNDPRSASEVREQVAGMVRGFQVKTPQDIMGLTRTLGKEPPRAQIWIYRAPKQIPEEGHAFLRNLADTLKGMGKNATPDGVQRAFADARVQAKKLVMAQQEAVSTMAQKQAEQVTARAVAASAGKDADLLPRLEEKLQELRKGYGIGEPYVRRTQEALRAAKVRGAPRYQALSDLTPEQLRLHYEELAGLAKEAGVPLPQRVAVEKVSVEVGRIQSSADAVWRNLNAGKYTGARRVEMSQSLLDADKEIWRLTDGQAFLDTRKWGKEAAVPSAKGAAAKAEVAPKAAPRSPAPKPELAQRPDNTRPMAEAYAKWSDEMVASVDQTLADWEQQALAKLAQRQTVAGGMGLSEDTARAWAQMIADDTRKAVDSAGFEVDKLLFDYSTRGGIDKIMGAMVPFYKYQTGIVPWAARTAIERPALPAAAVKYEKASATDVQQQGLPPRYKGSMPVPRPISDALASVWNATMGQIVGQTPTGVDYRVNPKNLLAVAFGINTTERREPYYRVRGKDVLYPNGDVYKSFSSVEEAAAFVENKTKGFKEDTPWYVKGLRQITDAMETFGMRPWPHAQALLYKMGVYGDEAYPGDVMPFTTALRAATGLRGQPVDLEAALKEWETNGAPSKILEYYASIEIAKRVQDGRWTKNQAALALADPNSAGYKDALRVAQQSADVRSMIRKFIPMTTRFVDDAE